MTVASKDRPDRRGIGAALRNLAFSTSLYGMTLGGARGDGIAVEATDPWPGDPERGRLIVDGRIPLSGRVVEATAKTWTVYGKQEPWQPELHAFAWLRDLRDLGGDAARSRARELIGQWLVRHQGWDPLVWRPDVLGERIAAWLGNFAFFGASADESFLEPFYESLGRQWRHLGRAIADGPDGAPFFSALKGYVIGAVCLDGTGSQLAHANTLLDRTIRQQIRNDGGHASRSPALQLAVLQDLIEIRNVLRAAGREGPESLGWAIDAGSAVLRLLRHGDGGLALFNGSTEGRPGLIDTVIAQSESKLKAPGQAPETGFQRLAAGRTCVIVDCGVPSTSDGTAHAGTLSFEVGVGKERLIVNCGAAPGQDRWDRVLRATAAHSALVVDDTNAFDVLPDGELGRRLTSVECHRDQAEGSIWLDLAHDGYVEGFGLIHRRRIYLSSSGDDLRGEDTLTGPGGQRFDIRFHLHPRVGASLIQQGSAVLLRQPSGLGWRFRASGAAVALQESVYFGEPGQMKRCRQIVLSGPLAGEGAAVKWALHREDRRA